jgi:M6 family metalloprotease-like protein
MRGFAAALALLLLASAASAGGAPDSEEQLFADFEDGTYGGWRIEGRCFGRRPPSGALGRQNPVSGWSGKHLVNTFRPDDGTTGTATSRPFRITERYVRFLLGGGRHPGRCCLELVVEGKVVRTATGRNSETLLSECWNVEDLIGQRAKLRIADRERGPWGHILVDRISFGAHPRFDGAICCPKLRPVLGRRKVLVILWDPHRHDHPAPKVEEIDRVLFGPGRSTATWFRENSGGRLVLERAGLLGWFDAKKPGDHYWTTSPRKDPKDTDGDGWLSGHQEKWAEAILKADPEFDFSAHDANGDKVLSPDELGILIVIPQAGPFGTNRPLLGREYPTREPLVVDGVRLPVMAEWYTGIPPNLGAPPHELAHLLLGAPDLYQAGHPWRYAPGGYSLMDQSYSGAHLDPFLKLKLGWLDPRPVSESGEQALRDVETTGEVLVLYDGKRGLSEYFLLENRWRGTSLDAGAGGHGRGIPADGLAIWHVLEDPALFDSVKIPIGGPGEWGRRGIRLVRANGGRPADDRAALFSTKGARISDETEPANLRWLDGSASGFELELLTGPGAEIRVRIAVRRP